MTRAGSWRNTNAVVGLPRWDRSEKVAPRTLQPTLGCVRQILDEPVRGGLGRIHGQEPNARRPCPFFDGHVTTDRESHSCGSLRTLCLCGEQTEFPSAEFHIRGELCCTDRLNAFDRTVSARTCLLKTVFRCRLNPLYGLPP